MLEEEVLHRGCAMLLGVRHELLVGIHVILGVPEVVRHNQRPHINFRDARCLRSFLSSLVIGSLASSCHRSGCQRLVAQHVRRRVLTLC